MFQDKDCFERFAVLVVGAAILGVSAIGLPQVAAVGGVAVAATELWARVRGKAQSDAPKVVARLSAALRDEWDAWGKTSSHADDNLRASARASFEEVIDRLNLDPAALVGQRLDAEAVADLALSRAAEMFPEKYGDPDPKNAEAQLTRKFLHDVTLRAYGLLLDDAEFVSNIAPALWRGVLGQLDRVEADTKLLVRQMKDAIRDLALKEGMVIGIARRIAEGVEDFDTAFRELERAIGIAARMEREAKLPSNSGDQITRVLAELSRLNGENRLDDGASLVMDAFDRLEAERARLIEIGLEQDILRRNIEGTAKWVVRQVLTENAVGRFAALRAERDRWYERGRDKGLNFDSTVAIELAQLNLSYSQSKNQHGDGLIDLGKSILVLGIREAGIDRLLEAANKFELALKDITFDSSPLNWAHAQVGLAKALAALGEREAGTESLWAAKHAYEQGLMEFTREAAPLDWARTQRDLGHTLSVIGQREGKTELRLEAFDSYCNAFKEFTEEEPIDLALTHIYFGEFFASLGHGDALSDALMAAIDSYTDSLKLISREENPVVWARAKVALANAHLRLAITQESEKDLKTALSPLKEAFEVIDRDNSPLEWVLAKTNLSLIELMQYERTNRSAHIDSAHQTMISVLEFLQKSRATKYYNDANEVMEYIKSLSPTKH